MDKDRIMEKIKKCLALSKSCEPHEAALALKRAQELMKKHGVNSDDVKLSEVGRSGTRMGDVQNPPRFLHYLVSMISNVFGCKAVLEPNYVFNKRRYVTDVSFIGFGPNPELAAYGFEVLGGQLIKGRRVYLTTLRKNLKRATKTRRGDLWAEAWVKAASKKAITLSLSQEKENLIEKWKAREYGDLEDANPRGTKFRGRGDFDAISKGIAAGLDASLHHGVGGSGTATLKIGA